MGPPTPGSQLDADGLCPPGNGQTASEVLWLKFPDFFPPLRETWEVGVGVYPSMCEFKIKKVI